MHVVAHAGNEQDKRAVREAHNIHLILADAHGFDEHILFSGGVEDQRDISRRAREAAEKSARRHRPDKYSRVARVPLHPYPVAENRAACVRTRRIDRNNSNAISLPSITGSQPIDKRALPGSGRARHSNDKGPSGIGKNALQEIFRLRIVVFDRRDRAGNGADVSGEYLLGPRFGGCGHRE